jgi:hypothetical protein
MRRAPTAGFVRKPDGSAFAASAPHGDNVPPELALALTQARRSAGRSAEH